MKFNDLPASVREIAEVIGIEPTMKLINQLPMCDSGKDGRRKLRPILYVPKRLKPDHRLVEILGWPDAHRLVQVFGGEILYPANLRELLEDKRNKLFRELVPLGFSPYLIAELVGMSERGLRKICRELAPEDKDAESGKDEPVSTQGD